MSLRNKRGQFKTGNKGFWLGKKRLDVTGENNPKWVGNKNNWICKICEKQFRKPKPTTGIPKYCSMACYGKSKKGKAPWNKYKSYPQITGKQNNKWKGGITPKYWNIRSTANYQEWRKKVLQRDNRICQICKKVPYRNKDIIAHHIKSAEEFIDLRFELSNGMTLCRRCHNKLHHDNKGIHDFTKILRDYMSNIA